MGKYINFLLLLLFTSVSVQSHETDTHTLKTRNLELYNNYSSISNDSLIKISSCFANDEQSREDATVCFSILVNRYYQSQKNKKYLRACIYSLNMLGYQYLYQYFDYSQAYYYLRQAMTLSEESGFNRYLPSIYVNMGTLYQICDNKLMPGDKDDKALQYMRKAFYAGIKDEKYKTVLIAFINMTNIAYFNDNILLIEDELEIFENIQIPEEVEYALFAKKLCDALKAYSREDYEAALNKFDEMPGFIGEKMDKARCTLMISRNKFHLYSKLEQTDEVSRSLKESLEFSQKYSAKDVLISVYKDFSSYYSSLGFTAEADFYKLRYLESKDSLDIEKKYNAISNMELQYELKSVSETMKELSEKRRKHMQIMTFGFILLVALTLFIIYYIRNYRRLKANHERLYLYSLDVLEKEKQERLLREKFESQVLSQTTSGNQLEEKEEARPKYQKSTLSDNDKEQLLNKISRVMQTSEEVYQENFTLEKLAELTDSRSRYVSQVMNETFGKTFNSLLAEYRIKEACRRMNNSKEYARFTIEHIAESVGFKSRTHFIATFKKEIGLTPSEYIKMAQNGHKSTI